MTIVVLDFVIYFQGFVP